jgi:hypothetical protein
MPELGRLRASLLGAVTASQPTVVAAAVAAAEPAPVEAAPIAVALPFRLRLHGLTAEPAKPAFDAGSRFHAVLLRPELISAVGLLTPDAPRSRSQIGVPICPVEQPSDTVLYEDPQDAAKRYYLPRYELKTVDGKVAMHIHEQDGGWRLSLDLQYIAAPELGDIGGATELTHVPAVILRYTLGNGAAQRELSLKPDPDPDQVTTHATLDISKEAELNEILAALTDPDLGAQLIVRRGATVALPVAGAQPIASAETTKVLTAQPLLWNAALLRSVRIRDHRAGGGGAVVRDHRTPVVDVPTPEPAPAPETAPPSEPQFRETAISLDHVERQLFVFSRERYGYVYSDVEGGAADLELKLYRVPFGDRQHRYYRDPQDPSVFHYLPDSFKLSRRPEPPHEPSLIVRYIAGTHGLDDVKVALTFVTVPYTDPARLQDAAQVLPTKLEDPLPEGTQPAFMPLSPSADNVSVGLSLPGGEGGGAFRRLEGARVDLPTVVSHTLEVSLEEFKRIYEALLGGVSVLFQGSVSVEFPDGTEQIPLHARIDDMVGPVFDEVERPGTSEGSIHLTLRNAIESAVTFSGISAQLVVANTPHPATVSGIDTSAPIDLAPGASVELDVVPAAAASGDVEDAVLDFAQLDVKPDGAKIYEAILDPTAPRDYVRAIAIRGVQFFSVTENVPVAVLVEFAGGSTAELTPDKRDAEAVVKQPLADYVLANVAQTAEPAPDTGDLASAKYKYKVTVITPQGRTESPDWTEDTKDVLYPVPPPVAVTP